ncbi:MAG: chemotaxis protein CheW, partial [Deltaproteobacteria bacterium]|nr:chemotaxis protein CheW [Deltaproteobacteria bacterium]
MNKIYENKPDLPADDQQKSLAGLLERLSERREAFSKKIEMTPEKVQEILKERAHKIRSAGSYEDQGELIEILEFVLGKDRYAFPLQWVGEVCRADEITEIPGTPAFVKGVVNVRSRIYSVIDLNTLLGLALDSRVSSESADDLLLILTSKEMEFAVCIDSLEGVRSLPLKCIQTSLSTLEGAQAAYFKGVTSDRLV